MFLSLVRPGQDLVADDQHRGGDDVGLCASLMAVVGPLLAVACAHGSRAQAGIWRQFGPFRRRLTAVAHRYNEPAEAFRMTYCCGILVRDGLVMIADTRTNAGLDNISTFRKLHVFTPAGRAHSGARLLRQPVDQPVGASACSTKASRTRKPARRETLMNAPTMFQAAQRIGHAVRARPRASKARRCEAADVDVRRLVPVRRPDQGRASCAST